LRSDGAPAAALREAAEQAAAEADRISAQLTAVQQQRADILLDGMDLATLDQLDVEATRLGRERERAQLAGAQLQARLEDAEQRERQAETAQIRSSALAARERGAAAIRRYGQLAAEMIEALTTLQAAESEIVRANVRLAARGDEKPIRGSEEQHWRDRRDKGAHILAPWSLLNVVTLPDPEKERAYLWPGEVYTPISTPPTAPKAEPVDLGPVTSMVLEG
jgi:hypothetical protein